MIFGLFFKILGVILFIFIIFIIFLWIKVKEFPLVIKSKDKSLPFAIGEDSKGGEEGGGGDAGKGEEGKEGEEKNGLKGPNGRSMANNMNMFNNYSARNYGSMAYPASNAKDASTSALLGSSEKGIQQEANNKDITSNYLAAQPRNVGNNFMNSNNLVGDPAEYNNMNNYLYNPMGVYDNLYSAPQPGNNYLMNYGPGVNGSELMNLYGQDGRMDTSFNPNNANLADKKKKKDDDENQKGGKKNKEELVDPLNANLTAMKDEERTDKNVNMANLADSSRAHMKGNAKEMLNELNDVNLADKKSEKDEKKKKSSKANEDDLINTIDVQNASLKQKKEALSGIKEAELSEKKNEEPEAKDKSKDEKGEKSKLKSSKLKAKDAKNSLYEEKWSKMASLNATTDKTTKSSLPSTSKDDEDGDKKKKSESKHHKDSHHGETLNEARGTLDTSNMLGKSGALSSIGEYGNTLLGHNSSLSVPTSDSF